MWIKFNNVIKINTSHHARKHYLYVLTTTTATPIINNMCMYMNKNLFKRQHITWICECYLKYRVTTDMLQPLKWPSSGW